MRFQLGLIGMLGLPLFAAAQTSSVELLGTLNAPTLSEGLGINVGGPGYTKEWVFAMIKAMGASHARIQCGWEAVEKQATPPANKPASPQYVQQPACATALTLARKYGLKVTEVAAFGPPYHKILTVRTTAPAYVGDTSISIELASGVGGDTLASLRFPYDYILGPGYAYYPGDKHSYAGTLITGQTLSDSTHGKISLAAALFPQTWGSTTAYAAGAGVYYAPQGKVYLAQSANTNAEPDKNPQIWSSVENWPAKTLVYPPGAVLTINEILYPSTTTNTATEPSVIAYSDYVNFLAKDMAARGVQGDVELWNEPPWRNDPWDWRPGLYDYFNSGPWSRTRTYGKNAVVTQSGVPYISRIDANLANDPTASPNAWSTQIPSNAYTGPAVFGANFGFVANLMKRTFPPGVFATWNGTSGSGTSSVMNSTMQQLSGEALVEPSPTVAFESHHPYGRLPEMGIVPAPCLQKAARMNTSPYACLLPGENTHPGPNPSGNSNEFFSMYLTYKARLINPAYGVGHTITETNSYPLNAKQRPAQARFNLRQFLGYMAEGYSYVEFFQFWDGKPNQPAGLNFIDTADSAGNGVAPWPTYTSFQGLMQDIAPLSRAPVAYTEADLATVSNYTGTYPLDVVQAVGSRANAASNSEALFLWQRSFCSTTQECWFTMASPPAAPATITIPAGMHISSAVNLITRSALTPRVSGRQATLEVTDDPIEVILDPAPGVKPGAHYKQPPNSR